MKACILLIEGTNCEDDALAAFKKVGFDAEKVHLKQLTKDCVKERHRTLSDYDILFLPGGWSAGDYIRAGAIFAARMKSRLGGELSEYVDDGKLVMGVCNGFQILVEAGLLPGFDGISEYPEAVLAINANGRFQCRPTYIRHDNLCQLTKSMSLGNVMQVPVAHAEGRLNFGDANDEALEKLEKNRQVIFRYCMPDGKDADGVFPWNPNGAVDDIAGISNPHGNILGMMPHPERVIEPTQHVDWTRKKYKEGDGLQFFKSILEQVR
ncbi:MAG: phosphoribosylformylglycinamidine synthase subunit PurQ [Candidatus Altiarchaeota archaeon]|nr:phosphoribosylformylglycinamidine synthase subunit PurQ [Candidatus Altiarchaeota archaeon]